MIYGVAFVLFLAQAIALGIAWQRFFLMRDLAHRDFGALLSNPDTSSVPVWLADAVTEYREATMVKQRAMAALSVLEEVEYRVAGAKPAVIALRVPVAATLSAFLVTWADAPSLAWAFLGLGAAASVAGWLLFRAGVRCGERVRVQLKPLRQKVRRLVEDAEPYREPVRGGRNDD